MTFWLSAVGVLVLSAFFPEISGFLFGCSSLSSCTLQCPNGYSTDGLGCKICQCAALQVATVSGPVFNPLHYSAHGDYVRPCLPHQQYCGRHCPHGYALGDNKCQFCLCKADLPGTTTPAVTSTILPLAMNGTTKHALAESKTPHINIHLTNPCIDGQTTCDILCSNGYLLGPSSCQYCICRPDGMTYTTAITTTPVSTTPLAVYLPNPCVQGQYVCEDGANCHDGFILGPNNCQYCMCAPHTTTVPLLPSSKPEHVDGHDGHASNTTDTSTLPGHMKNECTIALAVCSLKCKHGFMADTVDCKYCICKDEIYRNAGIAKGDEPTIQLMNPCVRGIDVCNIFCSHGYLRGPQNCQYCACGRVQISH